MELTQLDEKIHSLRSALAELTIRLINIKSEQGAPLPTGCPTPMYLAQTDAFHQPISPKGGAVPTA